MITFIAYISMATFLISILNFLLIRGIKEETMESLEALKKITREARNSGNIQRN